MTTFECTICCRTFRDNYNLIRHTSSKEHLDMVRKKNNDQDEEKEEMADPRQLPLETLDLLITNHPSYINVSKELTDRRQKQIDRFQFLYDLFLNYKDIDYSKFTEDQKEYYSENYNHPDLLMQKYSHLKYSSSEIQEMLEEKEALVDSLLKTHREYDREKPKWKQMVMNELIAEYRSQEKELEKKAYKDLRMKQMMEMYSMKK